jgi:hypothetical protein
MAARDNGQRDGGSRLLQSSDAGRHGRSSGSTAVSPVSSVSWADLATVRRFDAPDRPPVSTTVAGCRAGGRRQPPTTNTHRSRAFTSSRWQVGDRLPEVGSPHTVGPCSTTARPATMSVSSSSARPASPAPARSSERSNSSNFGTPRPIRGVRWRKTTTPSAARFTQLALLQLWRSAQGTC